MNTVAPEKPEEATQITETLSVSDRCDLCGSQAYVHTLFGSGDLMFCRHHFLKYEEKVRSQALEVIDETHKLS